MATTPALRGEGIPFLEAGDTLTRPEFRRRYEASPHIRKAELVEGVVFVASPVRIQHHAQPHALVMGWLTAFWAKHPEGLVVADNGTVGIDADNDFQPDALVARSAGSATLTDDDYLEGPPELVVEVASSSASYDLHQKLRVYRRAGVQEYVIWRVDDEAVDWLVWREGDYRRLDADASGVIESEQFPGLRLDVAALLAGDIRAVVAAVR